MNALLYGTLTIVCLFIFTLITNLFKLRVSLLIAIAGALYFTYKFLDGVGNEDYSISPLIFLIVCCLYILAGSKNVAYKTQTAVFSRLSGNPTGVILSAGLNWIDPIFEIATVSVNGTPNISVDLQKLKIEISETPEMQTQTRGIKAKVKHITFMLKLRGDIRELFDIEGGTKTVRDRIKAFVLEFFLDEIGHTDPVDLDVDKGGTIIRLAEDLKKEVNEFCTENNYPYQIVSTVTIGDTELEKAYYDALSKKALATLNQDAEDIIATRLRQRLVDFGQNVLRNEGSPKEQMEAAMIALKITPKTINDHKYVVDATIAKALTDIAKILANRR